MENSAVESMQIAREVISKNLLKTSGEYKRGVGACDEAIDEIKPVMPKVFDDWVKKRERDNISESKLIPYLVIAFVYKLSETDKEDGLLYWVNKDPKERINKCLQALVNGYEVEE